MKQLSAKVEAGEPLSVTAVGGSFTAVTSEAGDQNWFDQWAAGARQWWKGSNITVHNWGLGGTMPALARLCWEEFTRGEPQDLIFVEYAPNTHFSCSSRYQRGLPPPRNTNHVHARDLWLTDAREGGHPECVQFDLLVRKLLFQPNKPLVIIVNVLLPSFYPYLSPADEGIQSVADFYDVPVVSMRHALHRLQARNVSGYTNHDLRANKFNKKLFHLNEFGNKYLADIVMNMMERILQRVAQAAKDPLPPEVDAALNAWDKLPVALGAFTLNVSETLYCMYYGAPQHEPPYHKGKLWIQGDDGWRFNAIDRKRKRGWDATRANATLEVSFVPEEAHAKILANASAYPREERPTLQVSLMFMASNVPSWVRSWLYVRSRSATAVQRAEQ